MTSLGSAKSVQKKRDPTTSVPAPAISLPKGGGAIRGIGEKFAANPVTGTGSMTVPIATSPGRSGFGPQLTLSYDSGSGNGPFGIGWSLSLPCITRKTDKGLPRYDDANESDVFILSGAEDLVPVLVRNDASWVREELPDRRVGSAKYRVQRYRPRIEGLFARIERWTNRADPTDTFWRSISKDNVTTWYGRNDQSRVADPADQGRIFSWLIYQSHDDKGNFITYEYKPEDSAGINLAQAHEANRKAPPDSPDPRSANRYLKRIRYGNATSPLAGDQPIPVLGPDLSTMKWFFEVVFDYGEGHYSEQKAANTSQHDYAFARPDVPANSAWPPRFDPFSSYRAGFEVRTYRLCRRVLMFHHFPNGPNGEPGYDGLVRSTEFIYKETPIGSFIASVIQSGYVRQHDPAAPEKYLKKSLPPLEFTYSEATIDPSVHTLEPASVENLPCGLHGSRYQWVDLDGEGVSGILTEQSDGWFYKRNLSPINTVRENDSEHIEARFSPAELVASKPGLSLAAGHAQFMDLAGDGQPDLVTFESPTPGFYERTDEAGWEPFRSFRSLPNLDTRDPNLKFIDLDGDGHADILISEDEVFRWHASLAEDGFGPAEQVRQSRDEETGPQLVFADGAQSIYLADLSGDGLTDLVRIRNGEVCYWPNLGYGWFGPKVTMDNSPSFDAPDQFDQKRIRLADIDGSGTTDIIYLGRDRVAIYRNCSGNSFSDPEYVTEFPRVDNLATVQALDLLGNGTACLVWSSPLPGDTQRPMRYIKLMGEQKPHLLVKTVNNLGAETQVAYAPSTKFYLQDRLAGEPWSTKLPFPVHVVERVETIDQISQNRFVTCYAYHHGYFDGEEREFRGFGCVEQWDTEELAALKEGGALPDATNIDESSYVPPAYTRTWFHTGAWIEEERISRQFEHEYYHEGDESEGRPGLTDEQLEAMLVPDTVLPTKIKLPDGSSADRELTADELREACRALKGSILRREIYAQDGTDAQDRPYSVTEQNYTIELLQPCEGQRHAVFFTHPRESVDYHYERKLYPVLNGELVLDTSALEGQALRWLPDPRVTHALTLEVDAFGNVLKSAAIAYPRRFGPPEGSGLSEPDIREDPSTLRHPEQNCTAVTLTENRFTDPYPVNGSEDFDNYRGPLPCESRTFEIRGLLPPNKIPNVTNLFLFDTLRDSLALLADGKSDVPYEDLHGEKATHEGTWRRLIEHTRTLYRKNDLSGPASFARLESLALPYESYELAFTKGLAKQIFIERNFNPGKPTESELENTLSGEGGYVHWPGDSNSEPDDQWWIPSGRTWLSPVPLPTPDSFADDPVYARQHFYLPQAFADPWRNLTRMEYDDFDFLILETRDALDNIVTVRTADDSGGVRVRLDYRVLQPCRVKDPNGNCSAVAFDALGMVAGTAVMGKPPPARTEGDSLEDFVCDVTQQKIEAFFANPREPAPDGSRSVPTHTAYELLGNATTRILYDLKCFQTSGQPVFAAILARETHVSDLPAGEKPRIQISFSYSDGFGREIQKKIQAEPGPAVPDGPVMNPQWVGSSWTVFNNKGKPVRQYEPFFSKRPDHRHLFEFARKEGVSPVLFYDPLDRVVATLHPNHTYEKVVFDPWQQNTWDVNDTVTLDPRDDEDVKAFFVLPNGAPRLPEEDYLPSWYALRTDPAHAKEAKKRWPASDTRDAEKDAALKTAVHAATPATAHADPLGRTFLTVAHNKFKPDDAPDSASFTEEFYSTRVVFDIEGNQRDVIDAKGRIVMRYDYTIAGPGENQDGSSHRIHQASMEAGERWILKDVAEKPIRAWDSRGHCHWTEYDALRRPIRRFVRGADATKSDPRTMKDKGVLCELTVYGEKQDNDTELNLRTRVFKHFDSAGVVTNLGHNSSTDEDEAYDFKGNLLRSSRAIAEDYKKLHDWAVDQASSRWESYASGTRYDALNRPTSIVTPDRSEIRHVFNEANLLEKVDVHLRGAGGWTPFVTNVDYNAKGQRTVIEYGNGARTDYDYDPETFRLADLRTHRGIPLPAENRGKLQSLNYTYDPAGNITRVRDDAQQTNYFSGQMVRPRNDYTYDAVYRLIRAGGREHKGQVEQPWTTYNDCGRVNLPLPQDVQAMRNYTERYEYDPVGNFKLLHHFADNGNGTWQREYGYSEPSLIPEDAGRGFRNNRLNQTTVGGPGVPTTDEPYSHDDHGNMTSMPQLSAMAWDFKDQLQMSSRQRVDDQDEEGKDHEGERTYYVYDSAGQRVRKVTEAADGHRTKERIYVGGFEVYREYNGADSPKLERETLHIMDDKQRIALVETKTADAALSPPVVGPESRIKNPQPLIRCQFGNHLGSACLELDGGGKLISYEEYTPYGSTSYQTVNKRIEANPKRYRYTGKERDEESGLNYYGVRYYAAWIGRWTSCDPLMPLKSDSAYRAPKNPIIELDVGGFDEFNVARIEFFGMEEYSPEAQECNLETHAQAVRNAASRMQREEETQVIGEHENELYQGTAAEAKQQKARIEIQHRTEELAAMNSSCMAAVQGGLTGERDAILAIAGANSILFSLAPGNANEAARHMQYMPPFSGRSGRQPPMQGRRRTEGRTTSPPSRGPLPRQSDATIAQQHMFDVQAEVVLAELAVRGKAEFKSWIQSPTGRLQLGNLMELRLGESLAKTAPDLYEPIPKKGPDGRYVSVADFLHLGSGKGQPFLDVFPLDRPGSSYELMSGRFKNAGQLNLHLDRWYGPLIDPIRYVQPPRHWPP